MCKKGVYLVEKELKSKLSARCHTHCTDCFQVNMASIRQSRPHSGIGFEVKVRATFEDAPSSKGSGPPQVHGISRRDPSELQDFRRYRAAL